MSWRKMQNAGENKYNHQCKEMETDVHPHDKENFPCGVKKRIAIDPFCCLTSYAKRVVRAKP